MQFNNNENEKVHLIISFAIFIHNNENENVHLIISSAIFIIYVGGSEEEGGKGDSSGVQVQLLLGCYRVTMNWTGNVFFLSPFDVQLKKINYRPCSPDVHSLLG